MSRFTTSSNMAANRRKFLQSGMAVSAVGLLGGSLSAFGEGQQEGGGEVTKGDIAILKFVGSPGTELEFAL